MWAACGVCMHAAIAFSCGVVRIFEGRIFLPTLHWHFPRTDAAECDTQFYKLFVSVILPLEDISQRVIDTVLYRCQLFGLYFYIWPWDRLYRRAQFLLSVPLDISVYDGSVARPVELFNACSVNIGGGRPQAGVVDSGTLSFALCICISTAHHIWVFIILDI